MNANSRKGNMFLRLLLGLVILGALVVSGQLRALASPTMGPVAYVLPNQDTGDEIHLIEADGQNDRLLWHTGVPSTPGFNDIQQLAWKPDASELAFTSSHEADCSLYQADIYTLRSDGQEYRRVSGPPACGNPDHLPTGTVRVPVENQTDETGAFAFYFEGAPGPIEMVLPPGETDTLIFENVADYGDQMQYAVAILGDVRVFYPEARVDVQPGATLETGTMLIRTGFEHFGFQWPSYTQDGSKIASIFNKGELHQVDSDNREPGVAGGPLPLSMPLSSDFLAWGPTADRADKFLYEGWQDSDTIFLGDAKSGTSQLLLTIDPLRIGKTLLGLAWLPDGSGFLYSVTEMVNWVYKADLYEYSFATGQSERLTDLSSGFIRRVTVSPDGQQIVYEFQGYGDWWETNPEIDLWIMNRDGSEAALFVENGRSPAWSPRELPPPPTPTTPSPSPTPVVPGPTPTPPPSVESLPFRQLLALVIR